MKKAIFIIIGVLVVLALGAGLYWFSPNLPLPNPHDVRDRNSNIRAVPESFREYRSERYAFSLLYLEDLSVKEYDEGGGASTITFENAETLQGFQIFIVSFVEPQITEEPPVVEEEPPVVEEEPAEEPPAESEPAPAP